MTAFDTPPISRFVENVNEKIRTEKDPVWKGVLIKSKIHMLDPKNWTRNKMGGWSCEVEDWRYVTEITGSEEATIRYFEDYYNSQESLA